MSILAPGVLVDLVCPSTLSARRPGAPIDSCAHRPRSASGSAIEVTIGNQGDGFITVESYLNDEYSTTGS
ncbi:MAG TPA: hypothetical protein VFG92_01190 [Agromyces sp.]|nr:hypothetical protein [Agromyces sp.]